MVLPIFLLRDLLFMEDFYETGYTPLSPRGRDKKKIIKFVGIFIIALALLLIGLGILGATAGKKKDSATPSPTIPSVQVLPTDEPTPELSPTPEDSLTPSPTQKVTPTTSKTTPTPIKSGPTPTGTAKSGTTSREDLSSEIQKGSGIKGASGQGSTLLKSRGYKVLSTGNADNYGYGQREIKVKAEKKEFLTQLKLDLGTQYKIESATSDLTGSTADAVVIVGKE